MQGMTIYLDLELDNKVTSKPTLYHLSVQNSKVTFPLVSSRVFSACLPEFPSVIKNADLVLLGVCKLLFQENDSGHVMIDYLQGCPSYECHLTYGAVFGLYNRNFLMIWVMSHDSSSWIYYYGIYYDEFNDYKMMLILIGRTSHIKFYISFYVSIVSQGHFLHLRKKRKRFLTRTQLDTWVSANHWWCCTVWNHFFYTMMQHNVCK